MKGVGRQAAFRVSRAAHVVSGRTAARPAYCVRRSCHESQEALSVLTSRLSSFAPLVTHTRPLDALSAAFTLTEHYADGVAKMVIKP